MTILNDEREHRYSLVRFGRTQYSQALYLLEARQGISCQFLLSSPECLAVERFQKSNCSSETDRAGHIRRTRFKLQCPGRKVCSNRLNFDVRRHLDPRLEWRHRVQEFFARPKGADAHWPTHLMSGEGQKIATQILHIDLEVRDGLCGVDEDQSSGA